MCLEFVSNLGAARLVVDLSLILTKYQLLTRQGSWVIMTSDLCKIDGRFAAAVYMKCRATGGLCQVIFGCPRGGFRFNFGRSGPT